MTGLVGPRHVMGVTEMKERNDSNCYRLRHQNRLPWYPYFIPCISSPPLAQTIFRPLQTLFICFCNCSVQCFVCLVTATQMKVCISNCFQPQLLYFGLVATFGVQSLDRIALKSQMNWAIIPFSWFLHFCLFCCNCLTVFTPLCQPSFGSPFWIPLQT